jgi:hypothetical protein
MILPFFPSLSLIFDDNLLNSNDKVPKLRWIQTPFNRIHVTVNTSNVQDQTSQTSFHDPYILSTKEQSCDSEKPNGHEPQQQSGEHVEDRFEV